MSNHDHTPAISFPPQQTWEQDLSCSPDEPLAPYLLERDDSGFDLFCKGLLYTNEEYPGTLYELGKTPNIDEIHRAYDQAEATYVFLNEANPPLAVSGGMLSLTYDGKGYISGVYCVREHAGARLGHYIVAALLQHALDIGLDEVQLYVFDTNERARRIYERAGFIALDGADKKPSSPRRSTTMAIKGRRHIAEMVQELLV